METTDRTATPAPGAPMRSLRLLPDAEQMCLAMPGLPVEATVPVPLSALDYSTAPVEAIYADIVSRGETDSDLSASLDQLELLFDGADSRAQRRAVSEGIYTDADGVLRSRYGLLRAVGASGA